MNIQHLKEYLVFAEELNYSVASKRLFIARTSLREHIAELEHELQVELVTKKSADLKLTFFGKLFLERARSIVQIADETVEEFKDYKDNTLCISVSSTGIIWLSDVLFRARRNILKRYPEKHIEIETVVGPRASLQTLQDGESNIAIIRASHGITPDKLADSLTNMHFFKLCTSDILFFVNEGNPLFEKDVITNTDVAGMELVLPQDIYTSYLANVQIDASLTKVDFNIMSGDFTDYQEYYASDFSSRIGSIPRVLLSHFGLDKRYDCRHFSIKDFPVYSDFYVVCAKDFLKDTTARLLFDEMKEIAASTQENDN